MHTWWLPGLGDLMVASGDLMLVIDWAVDVGHRLPYEGK